ncbi:MAG: trigger factor [Planctomycetota bacterium]|jgi:trigger factor
MAENKEQAVEKNKVKIEDVGPCKKKVSIEILEETIQQQADRQYEDLRRDTVLPGFRKGRAPRRLLEKRFGKETSEQIKLKLIADATSTALDENKLDYLREPDIDYEKIELPESGDLTFDFEIEVRPEFDLPKLEGITVDKPKLKVEDEQVDRELEQLQKWSGVWTPREDGKVELDDQIIADANLKIEDVEEEEKLDNAEIYVRPNGFVGAIPVETLDKLLIGMKAGETKQASVEVPKTYFREEYRGKKIDVKIKIKDIKFLKLAPIDDNFLQRLGVENEDELRDKITENLQNKIEQQARSQMKEQIYQHLLDKTKFDLPMDIVADQATNILQRQYTNLFSQGLTQEQIEEHLQQLQASSEQQAEEQLKTYFIMDKVAKQLEIDVTEEELNGHIAQLAIQRQQRPEKLREQMASNGTLSQFKLQVQEDKCINKLLESAKITEVEPKKMAKKAKKTSKKTVKNSTKKTTKKTAKKKTPTEKKSKKTTKKKTSK